MTEISREIEEKIKVLKNIISESDNIVFFGGAGTSTESGIPDFRSSDGLFNKKLYKHFSPEQLVSHSFFLQHPEEFFDFYKNNLIFKDALPNKAHYALAKLDKENKLKCIITQNIDGLHQRAGSKIVYELHGTVNSNTCQKCKQKYNLEEFLNLPGRVPKCKNCGSTVKPDVVLYEEALDQDVINLSIEAISKSDTLIIGGTSLAVYPAASFVNFFKGRHLIVINKSDILVDTKSKLVINESIGKVLDLALKEVF